EELTIQRLSAVGEQVYSHAGRLAELERNGLLRSAKLSRATMLHIGEDLDADFVVFGRFTASGNSLTIESRILKVSPGRSLPVWPEPEFALGEVYFARRDCDSALPWYARVPKTHNHYVEAVFATGVCQLLLGQPDRAEELFTSLQEALKNSMVSGADLPEILN